MYHIVSLSDQLFAPISKTAVERLSVFLDVLNHILHMHFPVFNWYLLDTPLVNLEAQRKTCNERFMFSNMGVHFVELADSDVSHVVPFCAQDSPHSPPASVLLMDG